MMPFRIFLKIVLSCLMLVALSCNKKNKEISKARKPYLLYFNTRDTLTYRKDGGLLRLRDTFQIIPYYWKGGNRYRIGPNHLFEHKPKHYIKYISKDSINNYEIVKNPWKGFNIAILDLSNSDSAYIVTVDYMYNLVQ